jgi:hypothetical protein
MRESEQRSFTERHDVASAQLIYCLIGGARRNRTDDLFNAIEALSQLSYGPSFVTGLLGGGFGRRAASTGAV